MNWVDLAIAGIIGLSVLVSVFRGFVREVLSLLAWVAAFWVATALARPASALLEPYLSVPTARIIVAYIGVMIVTLIAAGLVNYVIGQLLDKAGLSGTDRLLGALFGLARGAVVVLVAVLGAGLTTAPGAHWWQDATALPPFERAALVVIGYMPPDLGKHFSY